MSRAILVTGWRGARRIQERVDLHEVELVTRKNNARTANLVLTKEDGEEHTLKVTAPGIWRMQIDYRLRRIASAAAEGLKARGPGSVERSDLPTADEVEIASQSSREERDSLDERFFHEELGEWPKFESESAPGIGIAPMEVSEGDHNDLYEEDLELTSELEALEGGEVLVEDEVGVALVQEFALDTMPETDAVSEQSVGEREATDLEVKVEAEAEVVVEASIPAETRGEDEAPSRRPSEEVLHPIGDDIVLDEAMDATSAGDVVLDWLEPAAELGSVSLAGPTADHTAKAEVEPKGDVEPDVDAELEMVSEPDASIEIVVEPDASLGIVADTDIEIVEEHSGVIDLVAAIEPPEAELRAEPAAEAELSVDVSPAAEAELHPEPAAEAELDADLSPAAEAELRAELAAEAELSAEPAAEAEPSPETPSSGEIGESSARSLPIAARPFSVSRVYDRGEQPSTESTLGIGTPAETEAAMAVDPAGPERAVARPPVEPEPRATDLPAEPPAATSPAADLRAEPPAGTLPATNLSVEPPAGPSRRRPIRDLADLRPMSLADLIKQSEPTWTRLAEMD